MVQDPLPPRLAALLDHMPLEELAFTPVPVRARHDGWTVERQRGFILRLALGGSVSVAARGVGVTRKSAYRLREHSGAASFAAAWDKAIGWGRDRMLDTALEKAMVGERIPIVREGRCIGERWRIDNRLAFAVLNALDRRAERPGMLDPVSVFNTAMGMLGRDPPATENPATENKGK